MQVEIIHLNSAFTLLNQNQNHNKLEKMTAKTCEARLTENKNRRERK